ncbi:unnamed protein product [Rotaria sordida]|uniref:Uncharacterized protein n=1 Tax=Rotaria sordida TaxID=392033 RepID=A0A819UVW9_9BILA|nr:unnamed protein product [Rotaria sordida]
MVQLPMLVVNLSTQIDTVLRATPPLMQLQQTSSTYHLVNTPGLIQTATAVDLRAYDSYSSATINPPSQSDADYGGAPLLTPQCTLNDVIPTVYTYEASAG